MAEEDEEEEIIFKLEEYANSSLLEEGYQWWITLPSEQRKVGTNAMTVAWANNIIPSSNSTNNNDDTDDEITLLIPVDELNFTYYINKMEQNGNNWKSIPYRVKEQIQFVRKVIHLIAFPPVAASVVKGLPTEYQLDNEMWLNIASIDSNWIIFWSLMNDDNVVNIDPIRSNSLIMEKACQYCACSIRYIANPLLHDDVFLQDVLDLNVLCLTSLPPNVFDEFPFLVYNNLKRFAEYAESNADCDLLARVLLSNHEQYNNIDFVYKWVKAGLPLFYCEEGMFFESHTPDIFYQIQQEDEGKIYLLLAKYCKRQDWINHSFKAMPKILQSNKEFIIRILEQNHNLLHVATTELQCDLDLVILAFSSSNHDSVVVDDDDDNIDPLQYVSNNIRNKIFIIIQEEWQLYQSYKQFCELHIFTSCEDILYTKISSILGIIPDREQKLYYAFQYFNNE